jgi:hypothetical protein
MVHIVAKDVAGHKGAAALVWRLPAAPRESGLTCQSLVARGGHPLPCRLMVRQRILIPFIEVRILAGHPILLKIYDLISSLGSGASYLPHAFPHITRGLAAIMRVGCELVRDSRARGLWSASLGKPTFSDFALWLSVLSVLYRANPQGSAGFELPRLKAN